MRVDLVKVRQIHLILYENLTNNGNKQSYCHFKRYSKGIKTINSNYEINISKF